MKKGDSNNDPLAQTSLNPLYRKLEAEREYPRVTLTMPVQIGLKDGKVVCARLYRMSPDGLQVRCDPATARQIYPEGTPVVAAQAPEVMVLLRTRHGNDMQTQAVRCRLTYVIADSRSEIIMGLGFVDLLPEQRSSIDAILAASLIPAD
jgi:hypothetical protein